MGVIVYQVYKNLICNSARESLYYIYASTNK